MRIFLRPVEESDCALIVKWRNSEKVLDHCMTKEKITEVSCRNFYKSNVLTGKYRQFIAERIEENTGLVSYPIATVYLKDIDNYNKRCELCVFLSDDFEWNYEGQSIAIKLLLEIAFSEYGMHKVYSYVFSKHVEEIELLKSLGFSEEAVLKKESLGLNGNYEDVVRYVFFESDQKVTENNVIKSAKV